jgi:predicted NBD/HSP70 family sugar kinase
MALAELWFGQGRGLRNFICLGVRSGLGAGIIIDGQVYHGADNRAGEIGDWPCVVDYVDGDSGAPLDQPFVRLEDVASLQSVQCLLAASSGRGPHSQTAPTTEVSVEAVVQAALAGDKLVLGFLDQVAHRFGLVLNQLNCAFNPQKIILAGAFTAFGEVFLRRLQHSLNTFAPASGAPLVVNTQLGPFNGAIGAAALAVHEWKPIPS